MKVVVGLGNPENKYLQTYHNIGFCAVEKLASKFGVDFKSTKFCNGLVAEAYYHREKVLLVKPSTYMNLSGQCVLELKNKFKLDSKDFYIILDDIDLKKGSFRYRQSGSAGTHNGLRNIISLLKTEDIARLRIGIGRDERMDLADYVLSKIDKDSKIVIDKAVDEGIELLLQRLKEDVSK